MKGSTVAFIGGALLVGVVIGVASGFWAGLLLSQRYQLQRFGGESHYAQRLDRFTGKVELIAPDGRSLSEIRAADAKNAAENPVTPPPTAQPDPFADLRHFEKLANGPAPIPSIEKPKGDPLATFEPAKSTSP